MDRQINEAKSRLTERISEEDTYLIVRLSTEGLQVKTNGH